MPLAKTRAMTPIEIFEYKKNWQRGTCYSVRLHSDLRDRGKEWCKVQLQSPQWDFKKYTDNYEDTYMFEYKQDADNFSTQWPEFTNQ